MPPPSYAGIGSRSTPPAILALMESVGARRARRGWVLRTGASPGADQAFQRGACGAAGVVELYLPWPDFELPARRAIGEGAQVRVLGRPSAAARELAGRFHPHWSQLGERERNLLARDVHQVLGADLDAPARFVVCWTAEGSLDGEGLLDEGTGQALRIANDRAIPVFNLARPEHAAAFG